LTPVEPMTVPNAQNSGGAIVPVSFRSGQTHATRRGFVLLFGAGLLLPTAILGQQKIARIGFLSPTTELTPVDRAFLRGLEKLGYVDGKTIFIEYRFAAGKFDRLPQLAEELVRLDVALIVARVTQASLAASAATATIPIVMLAVADPVGSGLVESLARPGANVTGTASMNTEVVGKSLEILKEVVPKGRSVAVLWNPENAVFQQQMLDQAKAAAAKLGLTEVAIGIRGPEEIDSALGRMAEAGADMLLVLGDPILIRHQAPIIERANSLKIPAIFASRDSAEAGGLMSYGPNIETQFRRAASYVDRILEGAEPSALPVEQPTEFELVVNLKTADLLGLSLPLTLLARADGVIE
jgi:ABC-type uncharacterized transport system substrate-binding protein